MELISGEWGSASKVKALLHEAHGRLVRRCVCFFSAHQGLDLFGEQTTD
jgi:hypothetical protein